MILTLLINLFLGSFSPIWSIKDDFPGTGSSKNLASPEEDASQAVVRRDLSLRGVIRFAVFVPGINGDYELLRTKYSIKIIEGTSGVIVLNQNSFDARAERYAFTYNRYIFNRLGCNFERPMDQCKNF